MGSKTRMDFTVMGDAVNIAFAMEETAKENDIEILVGQLTHDYTSGIEFGDAISFEYSNSMITGYPLKY